MYWFENIPDVFIFNNEQGPNYKKALNKQQMITRNSLSATVVQQKCDAMTVWAGSLYQEALPAQAGALVGSIHTRSIHTRQLMENLACKTGEDQAFTKMC